MEFTPEKYRQVLLESLGIDKAFSAESIFDAPLRTSSPTVLVAQYRPPVQVSGIGPDAQTTHIRDEPILR
jgi:hypothetical protein